MSRWGRVLVLVGGMALQGLQVCAQAPLQVTVAGAEVHLHDLPGVGSPGAGPGPLLLQGLVPGQTCQLTADQIRQQVLRQSAGTGEEATPDLKGLPALVTIRRACTVIDGPRVQDFLQTSGPWREEGLVCLLDQTTLRAAVDSRGGQLVLEQAERSEDRFRAVVRWVPEQDPGGVWSCTVTGRLESVALVPVLKQALKAGETLVPENLEMRPVAASQVHAGVVHGVDSLAGHLAVVPLKAGVPLKAHEVRRPVVVKRGQMLQAVVLKAGMTLGVRVQAAEEGGVGDTIRATNTRTHKTLHGVIRNSHTLEVPLPEALPQGRGASS